jgi:hypothetical protein
LLISKFPQPTSHTSNTVDKLNNSKLSGLVNIFTLMLPLVRWVVVLLLILSLALEDGELNHGGGSGGGGGLVAATVAALVAVEDRDRWWWRLMAEVALDGGHATTSRCSKRGA